MGGLRSKKGEITTPPSISGNKIIKGIRQATNTTKEYLSNQDFGGRGLIDSTIVIEEDENINIPAEREGWQSSTEGRGFNQRTLSAV